MFSKRCMASMIIVAAALAGVPRTHGSTAVTDATNATELETVRAELAKLRAEIRQLKADSTNNWLDERRAEEVKTLIREVLSDADTRASLLDNGVTAGHDGKKFFLASNDGAFRLNIGGQMQFRYIANFRNDSGDDLESGFTLRRTKLKFDGHVTANPKIKYKIVLAAERSDGTVLLEDFEIGFKLTDDISLAVGQMKLPFLREELLSSSSQLGLDRSPSTEYFTLDRGQGIKLTRKGDDIILNFMLSDGADSEGADFDEDATDIAFTGRIDIRIAGDWKQMKDFVAWLGEDLAAFAGAAIHYEVGETGDAGANNNFVVWTVDGLVEINGFTAMLAYNGLSTRREDGMDDFTDHGILFQVAHMVTDRLQPFLRYDFLDLDDAGEISLVTAGANYFFNKHKAKLTVDVVWALDPLRQPGGADRRRINNPFSDGLGLLGDALGEENQVSARAQFQLLF